MIITPPIYIYIYIYMCVCVCVCVCVCEGMLNKNETKTAWLGFSLFHIKWTDVTTG